jgi:hypothetical protein
LETERFDRLARAAASRASRRRIVTTLGAAALTALLAQVGAEGAAAACGKRGQKCGHGKKCCNGLRCAGRKCVTGVGTCPVGADTCAAGFHINCDGTPNCYCLRTTAGATRCGQAVGACATCATDADCEGFLGKGAFCVESHTGYCCLGKDYCAMPCPV